MSLYISTLSKHGLSNTKSRQLVFSTLLKQNKPVTINELQSLCSTVDRVTIYRIVAAFEKAGIIKRIQIGWKYKLELSDIFKPHHHHATCESCGASREVQSSDLEKLMTQLTLNLGLTPTKHHFELYGICKNCTQIMPESATD